METIYNTILDVFKTRLAYTSQMVDFSAEKCEEALQMTFNDLPMFPREIIDITVKSVFGEKERFITELKSKLA